MSERTRWLDNPRNTDRLVHGLYAACATVLLAQLLIHPHTEFGFEKVFGFYAAFGFLAYCAIVNSAKLLRRVVRRPEDYYDSAADRGDDEEVGRD